MERAGRWLSSHGVEDTADLRAQLVAWERWNTYGTSAPPPDPFRSAPPPADAIPAPLRVLSAEGVGVLASAEDIGHAGHVFDLAREHELEQLWVPRSVLPEAAPAFVGAALPSHDIAPQEAAPWLWGWNREHRRSAAYVVLAALDSSPFAELEPRELLAALVLFRRALGVPFRRSAGATGTDLLRELRGDPGPADPELPEPAASAQTEQDVVWTRELTEEERELPFVHAFDANGQYLAACSNALCGLGAPEHVQRPRFDPKTAGYWRATVEGERAEDAPDPFAVGPPVGYKVRKRKSGDVTARWYSTATIALAHELGMRVTISDAWLYPRTVRYLRPWYDRLREARTQLLTADGVEGAAALAALKATYRVTLGWLAGSFHDLTDPLYRPQWRHAVIATARANLLRRVLKLERRPFAVEVDALYFASAEPGPLSAAPEGLPLTERLGHFKWAGRAAMEDVRGRWAKPSPRAHHDRVAMLNRTTKEGAS